MPLFFKGRQTLKLRDRPFNAKALAVFVMAFGALGVWALVRSFASGPPASPPIAIGVYPGYNFPADIDSYTQTVGSKPNVVFWFQSFSEPLFYSSQQAGIDSENVTPQISWSPPAGTTLAELNSGSYDSYLTTQAQAAKVWGRTIQIRLLGEFNGNWNSYCPCVNGQTDAEFISFWQRVVNIFRTNGATNVQWVWAPNIYISGSGNAVPFDSMYPGDGYVDWVGLDGYSYPEAGNPSLLQVFKPSYNDLVALTNKPVQISEWGASEQGMDKAAWIRQGFLTDLPQQMPRVSQVDSFDIDNSSKGEYDWRVNSSPAALAAYQAVLASPLYGGPKTGDLNGDNQINVYDLSILLSHFNASATAAQGDLNQDGICNISDLSILLSNWGH